MSDKLQIGILGGGGILGAHGPAFVANGESCSVAMVAEPNPERHAKIRELVGDQVEIVPDYRDVLKEDRIDAIDIPHKVKRPLDEYREEVEKQIELAAECGWHELHTAFGGGEERYVDAVSWVDQLADAALFIRSLAPVLRAHESRINVETHGDVTTFELIRLIEDVGPDIAGICLDTANLLCQCENPTRASRRAAPYVHMTHIKDAMITFTHSGYRRQSLPPGRGILDWRNILPALAEYEPNLRLSIEDHKWLFDFHVFDPHWLRLHPDLTVEEFASIMQIAWDCQQKMAAGELPDPETYNAIPYFDQLEERLAFGRDYLNDMLDRLDLHDRPDIERPGMHRPMVPREWPIG